MKADLKFQAIDLRKQGFLFAEIARELNVAKSSVSLWTKDVELNERGYKILLERKRKYQLVKIQKLAQLRKERSKQELVNIRLNAKSIIDKINLETDDKKLLCSLLFWCEGSKDVTSGIRFTNSDPLLVKKFMNLFRDSFELDESRFRALIHLHDYHDVQKQLIFWSEVTNIPISQFHNSYQKSHSGNNVHPNYQGCINIRYNDNSLGKLLKMIYSEFGKL